MNSLERRAAFSLAGIFGLRMLGLFLILPVFALYAEHLQGVTPVLVGLAIGIYGLTQAMLQIPFGLLSDRIGRKPVIIGGLLVFAAGSALAGSADDILGVIIGRALQGSGAIAAAVMALAADLTREEQRTKTMAIIGTSIGAAFILALVAGPLLNVWIGVPGIFWLTAVLAVGGMAIVAWVVPTPLRSGVHRDAEPVPAQFSRVLRNPELLRLDLGILTLHMNLTALFLAVPPALQDLAGLDSAHHWLVYLPVMLVSIALMVPFIIRAEKHRQMKPVFLGAVATLGLSMLWLYAEGHALVGLVIGLLLFFTGFNLLEATLPSLVSKVAPAESKGTAMGVYSTSQFSGAFLGGLAGGYAHQHFGLNGVFLFGAVSVSLWLIVAWGMRPPRHLTNQLLRVGPVDASEAESLAARLMAVPGVAEAVVIPEDGVAYLKVDSERLEADSLDEFSVVGA